MSASSGTTLISPTSTLNVGSRGPSHTVGPGGHGNASSAATGHANPRPRRQSSHAAHGAHAPHGHHAAHAHTKRRQSSHSHGSHTNVRRQSEGDHGRRALVAGLTMQTMEPAKPKRKGSGDKVSKPPNKSSRSDSNIPSLSRHNSDSSSSKIAKAAMVRRASSRQSSRASSRHSSPAPLNRRKSVVLDSAGRETIEVDSDDDDDWEEEEEGRSSAGRPQGGNVRKTSERLGKSAKQNTGASADMRRTMSDSQAKPSAHLQPLTRTKSNVIVKDGSALADDSVASGSGPTAIDVADTASAATSGAGAQRSQMPNPTRKTTGFTGTQTHPDPSAYTPAHALNDPMHVMPAHQIKHQQSARSLHALTATDDKDRLQRARSQTGESRRSASSIGPLSRTSSEKGRSRTAVAAAGAKQGAKVKSPVTTPGVAGPQRQESALSIELSRNPTPAGSKNVTPAPTPGPSSPVDTATGRKGRRTASEARRQQAEAEEQDEVRVDASDALESSAAQSQQNNGPDTSPSYPFPKVLPEASKGGTEAQPVRSPEAIQPEGQEQEGDQASSEERKHTRSSRDPTTTSHATAGRRSRKAEQSPGPGRRSFPPGPSQLSEATKAPSTDTSSASTEPATGTTSRQASHHHGQMQHYAEGGSAPCSRQTSGPYPPGGKTLKHRYSNSSIRSIQSLRAPPHPLNSPTGYRSHMASAATTGTSGGAMGMVSPVKAKAPSMHYPPAAPPIINPEQAAGCAWEIPEDAEYGSDRGPQGTERRGNAADRSKQAPNPAEARGRGENRGQPPMPRSGSFASVRSFTNILSGASGSNNAARGNSSAHASTHGAHGTSSGGESPRPSRRRTALEATSQASKYRTTTSAAEYHSSLGFPSTSAETAHLISRFLPPKKVRRPAWDISPEDMRAGNIPAHGVGLTNGDYREAHESLVRTMRGLGLDGDSGKHALGGLGGRRGMTRSTSGLSLGHGQIGPSSPLALTAARGVGAGGSGAGYDGMDDLTAGMAGLGVVRGAQGNLVVAKGGWNGRTPFELSVDRCLAQRPVYRGVSGGVLS